MAYGLKYRAPFGSLNGNSGYVYIDEQDWVGGVTDLTLSHEGTSDLQLDQSFNNWEDPILGRSLTFTIINDLPDFYTLMTLITAQERQYRVRCEVDFEGGAKKLFYGFLNVDTITQKYLKRQEIRFTASSYLSKLNFFTSDLIETIQDIYFINLIDDILSNIGSFNIRVNSSLYDKDSTLSAGQTLFNKNGVNTEAFWEDNIKRKNNLEILRMILRSFNAFIYWYDDYWYIERYIDLYNTSPSYVEYTNGVTYDADDTGTVVNLSRSNVNIHTLQFVEQSQTLHIDPGFKDIVIDINADYLILNLVRTPLIANEIPEIDPGDLDDPTPSLRTWLKSPLESPFFWVSGSFNDIRNNISHGNIVNDDGSNIDAYLLSGLFTTFRVFVTEETNLKISWKHGFSIFNRSNVYSVNIGWYLKDIDTGEYLVYNDSSEAYEWQSITPPSLDYRNEFVSFIGEGLPEASKDLYDENNNTYLFSQILPLGEIGTTEGTHKFVLGILYARIPWTGIPPAVIVENFGDIEVTVNDTLEDNSIEAKSTSLFLNRKETELDLVDVANINYTNGILNQLDLSGRTSLWKNAAAVENKLTDWYLIEKYQLYSESRQRIFGTVHRTDEFQLLSLFTDSGQGGKKFVLMGYTYFPVDDMYAVKIYEIDIDTVVNLTKI